MEKFNVIIIGGGPAGYTAAIYCARSNLKPLLFSGPIPGGQLTETTIIENYPGFPDGISGTELMDRFRQQTENLGTTIIDQTVTKVDLSERLFKVTANNETYLTKSIIIATGATARWLGIESETKFRGKGVSACATCDGPFFKNKDVVVIGGGDTAMEEAQFLAKFASSVKIIHRRDQFRASKIMIDRVSKNPKIEFVLNSVVDEFIGNPLLEGVVVENVITHTKQTIEAEGAFIAIGHVPNTNVFQNILPIDEKGYIETDNPPFTNVKGIFVAGDVYDYKYRQAITAAGSGCQAAIQVEKYLETLSDNS